MSIIATALREHSPFRRRSLRRAGRSRLAADVPLGSEMVARSNAASGLPGQIHDRHHASGSPTCRPIGDD